MMLGYFSFDHTSTGRYYSAVSSFSKVHSSNFESYTHQGVELHRQFRSAKYASLTRGFSNVLGKLRYLAEVGQITTIPNVDTSSQYCILIQTLNTLAMLTHCLSPSRPGHSREWLTLTLVEYTKSHRTSTYSMKTWTTRCWMEKMVSKNHRGEAFAYVRVTKSSNQFRFNDRIFLTLSLSCARAHILCCRVLPSLLYR